MPRLISLDVEYGLRRVHDPYGSGMDKVKHTGHNTITLVISCNPEETAVIVEAAYNQFGRPMEVPRSGPVEPANPSLAPAVPALKEKP